MSLATTGIKVVVDGSGVGPGMKKIEGQVKASAGRMAAQTRAAMLPVGKMVAPGGGPSRSVIPLGTPSRGWRGVDPWISGGLSKGMMRGAGLGKLAGPIGVGMLAGSVLKGGADKSGVSDSLGRLGDSLTTLSGITMSATGVTKFIDRFTVSLKQLANIDMTPQETKTFKEMAELAGAPRAEEMSSERKALKDAFEKAKSVIPEDIASMKEGPERTKANMARLRDLNKDYKAADKRIREQEAQEKRDAARKGSESGRASIGEELADLQYKEQTGMDKPEWMKAKERAIAKMREAGDSEEAIKRESAEWDAKGRLRDSETLRINTEQERAAGIKDVLTDSGNARAGIGDDVKRLEYRARTGRDMPDWMEKRDQVVSRLRSKGADEETIKREAAAWEMANKKHEPYIESLKKEIEVKEKAAENAKRVTESIADLDNQLEDLRAGRDSRVGDAVRNGATPGQAQRIAAQIKEVNAMQSGKGIAERLKGATPEGALRARMKELQESTGLTQEQRAAETLLAQREYVAAKAPQNIGPAGLATANSQEAYQAIAAARAGDMGKEEAKRLQIEAAKMVQRWFPDAAKTLKDISGKLSQSQIIQIASGA